MNSKNYGWRDAVGRASHSYLEPVVINELERVNAKKVLDIGCGNGALCRCIKNADIDCIGIDADKEGIQIASESNPDIRFENVGVYDDASSLKSANFDAVVSTEVVEHLYSPAALPRFAGEVLGNGGYLIISTPYHGYVKNLVLSILDNWDSHHTALWEGGHIKFWSKKTLTRLLEKEGFVVLSFRGVGRIPFLWKSMVLVASKVN